MFYAFIARLEQNLEEGNQSQRCPNETVRISNLITVQRDATYSVYYISVGSSTCFEC